jgi:hypothetical protein
MVMGAMEMRRMGLISKPLVVVPNHMLEQVGREWLQIYPQARILAASSTDLTADKRRLFVARAAANDWDAVILTQGAFAKIGLRNDTQHAYIIQEVERVKAILHEARIEDRMSVKRIEKRILSMENKLKARTDLDRDKGVSFEDTGIDYLIVDEIHMYKNLATESNIQGAAIEGSDRATDLHMKLEYLRSLGRDRVVTGATATPISNSITEAYVMQKYMRPDLLNKAGIGAFDAWAATFGQTITQMEMAPTGDNRFRLYTRFAKFTNVPEMLRLWSIFADVKTADDLNLPTPLIMQRDDGQRLPVTEVVQPTVELEVFIKKIGERAQAVAAKLVPPHEDNMLTISTDARKAALDIRLVTPGDPSGPTKVDVTAGAIHRVWNTTKDNEYLDTLTGEPSEVKGALQLVFCDLGTPDPRNWNVYHELKKQLVHRGMPEGSIRYMHEAKTDVDKARMFAAARAGHVAVLIGSTSKMGVGTNVQARAVALYHIDCPWKPSDIAQREGRILRQGNQNEEIGIVRVVTERSFDAYMWQGVERKAKFIAQIMRGSLDAREIEEIDSTTLSAAEAKAISSGNPLLLEHATVQSEVARLRRLERAYHRNEQMLTHTAQQADNTVTRTTVDIAALESAVPRIIDTSGENFAITINGQHFYQRSDAAKALSTWANSAGLPWANRYQERDYGVIGSISGFDVTLQHKPTFTGPQVHIGLKGVARTGFIMSRDTFVEGGIGVIQRIENRVFGIPRLLAEARTDLERAERDGHEARTRIGQPFKHTATLANATLDLARIEEQLAILKASDSVPVQLDQATLDIERVRAYKPNLGTRTPSGITATPSATDNPYQSAPPRRPVTESPVPRL